MYHYNVVGVDADDRILWQELTASKAEAFEVLRSSAILEENMFVLQGAFVKVTPWKVKTFGRVFQIYPPVE